jgi:hypothetical protein
MWERFNRSNKKKKSRVVTGRAHFLPAEKDWRGSGFTHGRSGIIAFCGTELMFADIRSVLVFIRDLLCGFSLSMKIKGDEFLLLWWNNSTGVVGFHPSPHLFYRC